MMTQIDTGNRTGNKDTGVTNKLERSSSFSSTRSYKSDGSIGESSTRPSPTNQASFSAIVKVSKMQASFAERTATEMEEIVSWYQNHEGIERLQKKNQQSQSMPENAMIVDDDDDDDDAFEENDGGKTTAYVIRSINEKEDQEQKFEVSDEEFVVIKDYHTPAQRSKKTTPITSSKGATASLFSAVRSISKARKCDEPPPRAVKILVEDEDNSVISSLSPRCNADDSIKLVDKPSFDAISGDWIRENESLEETIAFRDDEEEVLNMLSSSGCAELKAKTLIESTDHYNDEEQKVLAILSPDSSSSKIVFSSSFTGKSKEGKKNDSMEYSVTGKETQSQIEATADVIRNTQNMAEIILQLQQSSSASGNDDDDDDDDDDGDSDDDDDIGSIYNNSNLDDNTINPSLAFASTKIDINSSLSVNHTDMQDNGGLVMHSINVVRFDGSIETPDKLDANTRITKERHVREQLRKCGKDNAFISNAPIASSRATKSNANKIRFTAFQVKIFYQIIVPFMLMLVAGLILKYMKV